MIGKGGGDVKHELVPPITCLKYLGFRTLRALFTHLARPFGGHNRHNPTAPVAQCLAGVTLIAI